MIDSGERYPDGTTRHLPGPFPSYVDPEVRACFTHVYKGMISISRLRWPRAWRVRIDSVARYNL